MPNNSNFDLGDSKLRFQYLTEESNSDKSINNITEKNNTFLNTFDRKPNFKYQKNHQFHKLVNVHFKVTLKTFKTLKVILHHKFSVIAVSETWTQNNDKLKSLEGYQNYCGVKEKSLKSR